MSNLTELIKELREKTGAGFLDCKKSLEENNNDVEKSIEALRTKGLAKASKKSDRAANEGAVGVYANKDITVIIKVNSETDFAAKSDTFLDFLDSFTTFGPEINKNQQYILADAQTSGGLLISLPAKQAETFKDAMGDHVKIIGSIINARSTRIIVK